METGNQIKKHRTAMGLSQEGLAEKVYVSRQTVSNWENEKNYPDIRSLILLGELFGISLDELVKGDIETMKKEILKEDIEKLGRYSVIIAALIAAMALSALPLVKFLGIAGGVIWVCIAAAAIVFAFKTERFKKQHDISTYKEIIAFTEGKSLEEIEKAREEGKRPYQNVLKALCGAVFGAAVMVIMGLILSVIK